MSQLQIRGSALWARREWLLEHHGEDGLEKLIGTMSAAGRHLLRSDIDPKSWHNYPLFIEVAIKVDEMFGDGDGKLNIEIGRASAHRNTKTLFKAFIRIGSVNWVLNQASKFWSEHFSEGGFEVSTDRSSHVAVGEVIDFPHPHLCHTYSVLGFAIGCIEMSGESNVRGEVVSCRSMGADKTVIRARWGADD